MAKGQLVLLGTSQVAVWVTLYLGVFLGPFAVRAVTGSFALGGLPFAMFYVATLLGMDRIGRGPVLASGHLMGALGAASVAWSLHVASPLVPAAFLVGLFLLSGGSAVAVLARVAAADLFPPERRAQGISRIVFLSFLGAALGALVLARLGLPARGSLAVGYLAMVPAFGVGFVATALLGRGARSGVQRPSFHLGALFRRPAVGLTVASNVGAQTGMGAIMSMSGAAMAHLGAGVAGGALLGHFAGMFLPSPLAGRVADRIGRSVSIALGAAVLAVGALLFAGAHQAAFAFAGLFIVGAGWCFTFVPGSALLADATSFEERGTVFGANDAVVAVVGSVGTVLAGFAYNAWGAGGLAAVGVLFATLPFVAGLSLRGRVSRTTPVPAPPAATITATAAEPPKP